MCTECFKLINWNKASKEVVVHDFNLVIFVRCTETIKEMHNRNGTIDCNKVSNTCKIHTVLNGMRAHHDNTSLTACINVTVITED